MLRPLHRPRVLVMLLLGFSSGGAMPAPACRPSAFSRGWGVAYSLKFLWAPFIDRLDAPLFEQLGRRRGWMVLSQILIGLALLAMALTGPAAGLALLGGLALVAAFASATQDIVIDAWRIEAAAGWRQ